MTEGRMLKAYGSVQVNSFVFERTFSCRTPFPYSPTNSRITASRLLLSSLLPVPWSSSLLLVILIAAFERAIALIFREGSVYVRCETLIATLVEMSKVHTVHEKTLLGRVITEL